MSATNKGEVQDINLIRRKVVTQAFARAIGRRALILIAEFPFMIIGTILRVKGDYVLIDVETTHTNDFESREMFIHIDPIQVFFIETPNRKIPGINGFDNKAEWENDE